MFVDRVKVELQAGRGGDGCMSFRREKYVARGGPDGGDGGDGGSIILQAREGVNSLADFVGRQFWRAPKGMPGSGSGRHGRNAKDMVLYVPPGTTVIDPEGNFTIKDLIEDGDSVLLARGGKGGYGNTHFKSATNRAPRQRTLGGEGEVRTVVLELKSIADVGLIGKPNAGKSTLLSRLSRAHPEIADYPFTTKYPNLGQVHINADQSFVLADIPGLIEGASDGVGLGHEFLRHVERAGILVHLVEPFPADQSDALENYRTIRHELKTYAEELANRPEIVVMTKAELPDADEVHQRLAEEVGGPVHRISAVTGEGVDGLLRAIWERLSEVRREAAASSVQPVELSEAATAEVSRTTPPPKAKKPARLPPHLAGPTAALSDENPPSQYTPAPEEPSA
ncbi:GTPase ObgE [Candidatus Laterigemmans baculatus]|uniref:GTPase ObgE n=1 Tax=Candidatus Laterigemmans baculatus TaxID=2770505 RepID=UPI0013DA4AEB|nr:GTPase ObgE [Candidatus Laterigemmans baculatus]